MEIDLFSMGYGNTQHNARYHSVSRPSNLKTIEYVISDLDR